MTDRDYTPPHMLPVIVDAPGEYETRGGELVVIDKVLDSCVDNGCRGTYSTGQRDSWRSTGRIFYSLLSANDIVRKKTAMIELDLVTKFYGERCAERSGVPLINHIHEGLTVLSDLDASSFAQRAWCLHPLVQTDVDLFVYVGKWNPISTHVSARTMIFAMEYRNQANAWLSEKVQCDRYENSEGKVVYCTPARLTGRPTPGPLLEVKHMLIADKVQNYKDFLAYHSGSHPRSEELEIYFKTWLGVLGISDEEFNRLCAVIDTNTSFELRRRQRAEAETAG